MKALSLTQPWATLVVTGEKEIETRSWRTNYGGMIAIHASKGFPGWAQRQSRYPFFSEALDHHGFKSIDDLPRGAIVGVASIVGCVTVESIRDTLSLEEHEFGDYSDGEGRWAWLLDDPQMIEPIPCSGALSLWEVPALITQTILERINLREPRREPADFVLS